MATRRGAKTTTDHDEIRQWVEARGGFPAHVKRTAEGGDPGVLRIDYPGFSGTKSLGRIPWDEFFEWFDRNNLAFVYQDASDSRFSKLVDRGTVRARKQGRAGANKTTVRRSAAKKPAAKKGATKKSATKKSAAKKSATKKSATKKGATKTAARRKK